MSVYVCRTVQSGVCICVKQKHDGADDFLETRVANPGGILTFLRAFLIIIHLTSARE